MKKILVLDVCGVAPAVKDLSFRGVEPIRGSALRVGLRLERETPFHGMQLFVLLEYGSGRGIDERAIELDACVNAEDLPAGYYVTLEGLFADEPELALMRTAATVLCETGRVSFSLPAVGDTLSVKFSMEAFEANAVVPLETVGEYLMRKAAP